MAKKNIYKTSKEVTSKEKELKSLIKQKKLLEQDLKDISSEFNSLSASSPREAENMLDRLPLETLRELYEFTAGKKAPTGMTILNLRTELKKERLVTSEKLSKLNQEISINKIDVLLSKVKFLLGEST